MTDPRYVIVYRNGLALDAWTAQLWDKLKAKFPNLQLTQGVKSGAAASGNTHRGLGVLDLYLGGHNWKDVLKYAFEIGFFGWFRPELWKNRKRVWKDHIHLGVRNHPLMDPSLKNQQVSWTGRRNGLIGNGPDFFTWRPSNFKKAAPWRKLTTIKIMGMNLPAPGVGIGSDLGNDAGRIKAFIRLRKKINPHVIAFNELGPTRVVNGKRVPSVFAAATLKALGKKFAYVVPTKAHNENYGCYRKDRFSLVKQYEDSILEAPNRSGNKHLTRFVLRYANGLEFAVGIWHLPPNESAAALKDRQIMAEDARVSMEAVSAKHHDCPIIIIGDGNDRRDFAALVKKGWKRARKFADRSAGAKATYTRYDKTVPSSDTKNELDVTYWSREWYVLTWEVVRDLVGGKYRKPRASDHDATSSTARI